MRAVALVLAAASLAACAAPNALRASVDGAWVDVDVRQARISPGGCGTAPPPGVSCPPDALGLSDGNADASNTRHALLIALGAGAPGQTIELPHAGIDIRYFDARLPAPSEVTTTGSAQPVHGQVTFAAHCARGHLCGTFDLAFAGAHAVAVRGRFDVPLPSEEARRIP